MGSPELCTLTWSLSSRPQAGPAGSVLWSPACPGGEPDLPTGGKDGECTPSEPAQLCSGREPPAPRLAPGGSSLLCPRHPGRRVLLGCCSSSVLLAPHSLLAPHALPCAGRWRIQRRPPFSREMNGEDPAWAPGSHPAAHSRRPIPQDASWTPFPSLEPVHPWVLGPCPSVVPRPPHCPRGITSHSDSCTGLCWGPQHT